MRAANDVLPAFYLSDDPDELRSAADAVERLSSGRIHKPETVNRRTNKPERGGIFCARVFGPIADHQCLCGKLASRDADGQVCDKCGVLCGPSRLRGERWGHLESPRPLLHPRLAPALAAHLRWPLRNLLAVVHFDAELKDDGTVVHVKDDDYQPEQRGPSRLAHHLGDDAGRWLLSHVPVPPPDWRGTRGDPQDTQLLQLINRLNRLSRLIELNAPQIILDNEERMAQEVFERLCEAVRGELRARTPYVAAPASPRADALLAAVYDDPDDDRPRQAYADHLTDAGDLRGEFITRQLESARRNTRTNLEANMLRRNFDRWIGSLAGAVEPSARFRRGFPSACRTTAAAAARVDDPAWSTVVDLETDIAELVAAPVMRSLASLTCPYRTLEAVSAGHAVLPRLRTLTVRVSRTPPPDHEAVTRADALPALHTLTLVHRGARPGDWRWLDDTPLARQLAHLTFVLPIDHAAGLDLPWWIHFLTRHPALQDLTFSLDRGILTFELRHDRGACTLRVGIGLAMFERLCLGDTEIIDTLRACLTAVAPHDVIAVDVRSRSDWWSDELVALARDLRDHFGANITLPRVHE